MWSCRENWIRQHPKLQKWIRYPRPSRLQQQSLMHQLTKHSQQVKTRSLPVCDSNWNNVSLPMVQVHHHLLSLIQEAKVMEAGIDEDEDHWVMDQKAPPRPRSTTRDMKTHAGCMDMMCPRSTIVAIENSRKTPISTSTWETTQQQEQVKRTSNS